MTLSYVHGVSTTPLLGETIGGNLERTTARVPDAEALVSRHQQLRYTYAELNDAVDIVARGLLDLEIEVGDRVGIWSPNNVEWVLLQYATAKIGAILVNINPAYRRKELRYALGQSGCRLLFSAESFKTSNYREIVDAASADLSVLERTVFLESPEWDELRSTGEKAPMDTFRARFKALQFDDPINIQYTSGTTGSPKGATLSHHNILNNGFFIGELCRYTEQDRVCIPVPFYHCFGMVLGNLACTTHGSCMVIPNPSFEPKSVLETVQAERCTSLYGVPTMFVAELELPDFDSYNLESLRTGIMAGSTCPTEVMKKTIQLTHMEEVTICYGMTETSPVSAQTGPDDDFDRRVSTVGRVHPHVEIKIVDPTDQHIVERDQPGELLTRGYSVMIGYWDDPKRTAEAIDANRWMHTGDLATMDEEGYIQIVGRIKDMIIRGGENIYPREIEEFLYGHPDVVEVAVVGVPDEKYGEQVLAWVQLRSGATLTEEELKDFCRDEIAHFKIPHYVQFVDEFPMTVTGKIQKFKIREIATKSLGLA